MISEHPYCIGCRFLAYSDKEMAEGSSWTGSYTIEQASMFCRKDHWRHYFNDYEQSGEAFERAMEHAASCADFSERPINNQEGNSPCLSSSPS